MAEIMIYDLIDPWFGVSPVDILDQLRGAAGDVVVRINSPGGSALDGVAIYNALKRYDKGKVIIEVDGLAASAASIIAMAGDDIRVSTGAMVMIHEAWGLTQGPAEDHEAQGSVLRKLNIEMAKIYAARSGMTESECLAIMAKETWMGADECKSLGFADTVVSAKARSLPVETPAAARAMASFKHMPASLRASRGASQRVRPENRPLPQQSAKVAQGSTTAPKLISTPLSQLARRS